MLWYNKKNGDVFVRLNICKIFEFGFFSREYFDAKNFLRNILSNSQNLYKYNILNFVIFLCVINNLSFYTNTHLHTYLFNAAALTLTITPLLLTD